MPILYEAAYLAYIFDREVLYSVCEHFALRHIHIIESQRPLIPDIYLRRMYHSIFCAPAFEPEQFLNAVRLKALEMRVPLQATPSGPLELYNVFGLSSLPIIDAAAVTTILDRILLFIGGHNRFHICMVMCSMTFVACTIIL